MQRFYQLDYENLNLILSGLMENSGGCFGVLAHWKFTAPNNEQ